MRNLVQRLSLYFAAGTFGGLVNSLALWYCAHIGLIAQIGVSISPSLTPTWLYPRLVWAGIWGWLFFLPIVQRYFLAKGLLLSLGPSLVQLVIVFPSKTHAGIFGTGLGELTPVVVLAANAVWGLSAALWLRLCRSL